MGYLQFPFAQHALVAGALVAITCGLIGPFVVMRNMGFAVHGTSELAFTGAAAGLLLANDAVIGAYVGSLVVATLIGFMSVRDRERDSTIGGVLAAGLGLGVLLLSFYQGFAAAATNILFGDIFGVSDRQLLLLGAIGLGVAVTMMLIYRPLLFASLIGLRRSLASRRRKRGTPRRPRPDRLEGAAPGRNVPSDPLEGRSGELASPSTTGGASRPRLSLAWRAHRPPS